MFGQTDLTRVLEPGGAARISATIDAPLVNWKHGGGTKGTRFELVVTCTGNFFKELLELSMTGVK